MVDAFVNKLKLKQLEAGLPPGVEIVPVYDRSQLIRSAVSNLTEKLIEESIIVRFDAAGLPYCFAMSPRSIWGPSCGAAWSS